MQVNCGAWCTIDECPYKCHNQWAGKVYNPNIQSPYGINFKCLNAAEFPYTFWSEVYAGKPDVVEEGGYYVSMTFNITVQLLEKYGWKRLEGCHLTTDNLYGSIPLAKKLLEKKMTFISTMRAKKFFERSWKLLEAEKLSRSSSGTRRTRGRSPSRCTWWSQRARVSKTSWFWVPFPSLKV